MAGLLELNCWHWFALGLLLLMAEMAGAGGYLLWAGIAAGITGGLLFLLPVITWQIQLLLFSVLSVVSAVLWWKYQKRSVNSAVDTLLNKRSAQYIGRIFTLSDPVENGRGKIRVDDSFWEVTAKEDMPVGSRVKVLSVEHDQIFVVEKH